MAEASIRERIAYARDLVQYEGLRLVGPIQRMVKDRFGRGIPPGELSRVFAGITKPSKRKTAARRRGRPPKSASAPRAQTSTAPRRRGRPPKSASAPRAQTSTAPRRRGRPPKALSSPTSSMAGSGTGFQFEDTTDIARLIDLVNFLNDQGGRTRFAIELDGQKAVLMAE